MGVFDCIDWEIIAFEVEEICKLELIGAQPLIVK